jgi:hypothetical protein
VQFAKENADEFSHFQERGRKDPILFQLAVRVIYFSFRFENFTEKSLDILCLLAWKGF